VTDLLERYGLVVLFLVVALESAGVPVPGETGLITASVLASQGYFEIAWVIGTAATAAIVGDNAGYWLGRLGGRRLLYRWRFTARYTERLLPLAERFFVRHGGKTIFFARFIPGLRVAGAWIAGMTRMDWWRFLLWNALGGITWAVTVGLLANYAGYAAAHALRRYGIAGAAVIAIVLALLFGAPRLLRHRLLKGER